MAFKNLFFLFFFFPFLFELCGVTGKVRVSACGAFVLFKCAGCLVWGKKHLQPHPLSSAPIYPHSLYGPCGRKMLATPPEPVRKAPSQQYKQHRHPETDLFLLTLCRILPRTSTSKLCRLVSSYILKHLTTRRQGQEEYHVYCSCTYPCKGGFLISPSLPCRPFSTGFTQKVKRSLHFSPPVIPPGARHKHNAKMIPTGHLSDSA